MKKYFVFLLALPLMVTSCKKETAEDTDDDHVHGTTGSVEVSFSNYVGDSILILDTKDYLNANGDTFSVSKLNYYISNVKLTASDNSVFSETESYHLLQASDAASLKFNLVGLPEKNYTSITFTLGVDSLRNVSGAQTGALDPTKGMFWNWNSGYIMAKMEGMSPQSGDAMGMLMLHVGGFSGANNVLKTITINFPSSINVNHHAMPQVKLKADLAQWFKSPETIDFATTYMIHMPGASAKKVADNYADMFSLISAN